MWFQIIGLFANKELPLHLYFDDLDIEDKRKEMQLYWSMESVKANNFIKFETRSVRISPLDRQPVISGLLALQAQFGEYW
jgi:hypothetical protein